MCWAGIMWADRAVHDLVIPGGITYLDYGVSLVEQNRDIVDAEYEQKELPAPTETEVIKLAEDLGWS